jgi:hypothetical protein
MKSKLYSRTKGHNAEREFANRFKDLGFQYCKTSRLSSRLLDNCDIDLSGIPFNIQIKSGYEKVRPKADEIFTAMTEVLKENFDEKDPIHTYPKILIHKMDARKPNKVLVTMTWEDFLPFLASYKEKHNL